VLHIKPILAALSILILHAPLASAASGTRVVHQAMGDFLEGELDGLAIAPTGELIAAPVSMERLFTPALYIWSMALDREGRLIAGTGDDGGVVRLEGEEFVELVQLEDQLVMAVADTRAGLLAGTGPEGKVYRIEDGEAVEVLTTEATTVWALAPSKNGSDWLAAVGPDAAVIRFDPSDEGTGETVTEVDASVVRRLLRDDEQLWMATQGPSLIMQSSDDADRPDRLRFDGQEMEIPDMVSDGQGGLWFLVLNPGDPEMLEPPSSSLFHLPAEGSAERIWRGEMALMSLAMAPDGALLAGEIGDSRVHRISTEGRIGLWRDFGDGDASALLVDGDTTWVGSSNLGDIFRLTPPGGGRGSFTSAAIATPAVQRFGRLWVDGSGDGVRFSTRSGMRAEPDDSWSDWSGWKKVGEQIQAPLADYIQYRLTVESAQITGVNLAWARRDHAPRIHDVSFTSNNPGDYEWSEPEGNDNPDPASANGYAPAVVHGLAQVVVSAGDLDGDELSISVEVQRDGGGTWFPLSREELALRVDWDTRQFEDGTWRARASAHDLDGATLVELISPPVIVDNSMPRLAKFDSREGLLSFRIEDSGSRLARVEFRPAGSERFRRLEPVDGVVDGDREDFQIQIDASTVAVWIRATDVAGNEAVFAPPLGD